MEIKFRNMEPNDVDSIINVHKESIYGLCEDFYSEEQMRVWTELFNYKIYNEGIKDPANMGVVALDNGKIIGYGFINLKDKEVKGMYLLPKVARNGVGRMMLSRLEVMAREHGLDKLVLNSTLNAVPFYEKRGYVKVRDEIFELTGNCALPCVYMRKDIQK